MFPNTLTKGRGNSAIIFTQVSPTDENIGGILIERMPRFFTGQPEFQLLLVDALDRFNIAENKGTATFSKLVELKQTNEQHHHSLHDAHCATFRTLKPHPSFLSIAHHLVANNG